MLIINYKDQETNKTTSKMFNIFDIKNHKHVFCLDFIISIIASERELQHIQELFSYSIPTPRYKDEVTWYGDLAKTIVANL